jgi:hypothetical protein
MLGLHRIRCREIILINLKEPDMRLKELGFYPIHRVAAAVV